MAPNESAKPRWCHLEYRWRLENFWELRALASIEALEDDTGDVVWSRRFGDNQKGLWRLKIYPYGDASPGGRTHVSLFLSLDVKSLPVPKAYAIFGCYVLDDNGEKIQGSGRSFTRQKFAEGSSSWGWSQFVKVENQSLNKMLVNNSLTIKCDLDIFLGVRTGPGVEIPPSMSLKDEVERYSKEEAALDFTVKCGSREFKVSRFILAARSTILGDTNSRAQRTPVFSAAVSPAAVSSLASPAGSAVVSTAASYTSFGEPEHGPKLSQGRLTTSPEVATHSSSLHSVTLTDVDESTAERLITYIQTDSCDILATPGGDIKDLSSLFLAASVYGVQSLFNKLVDLFMGRLCTKADALAINVVAGAVQCEPLVKEARFFLSNMTPSLTSAELYRMLGLKIDRSEDAAQLSPK